MMMSRTKLESFMASWLFYERTLLFSGTKFHNVNIYFPRVFDVRMALDKMLFYPNVRIKSMGRKILDKWEKYWDKIHRLMGVACIFGHPR